MAQIVASKASTLNYGKLLKVPSLRRFSTAFVAMPLRSGPSSTAPSGCCAAADSSTRSVSVSLFADMDGSFSGGGGVLRRHHRSPAVATSRRGRIRARPMAFHVAATVTLCSRRNASPFWIMLWLVSGLADQRMILAGLSRYHLIGAARGPKRDGGSDFLPALDLARCSVLHRLALSQGTRC